METQRPLILVIEDDRDIRDSITEILEDEGFAVASAQDGEAGLAWLANNDAPALILLDLLMPRLDARGFRGEQMKNPAWAQVPTVIMSADRSANERALELGATAGVQKPVRIDDLLAVVSTSMRAAI